MPVLKTKELQVSVGTQQICDSLNLSVEDRQSWAILGCNGIGKTTLLHTLAGLRSPDSGTIELMGKEIASMQRKEIARNMGILFQQQDQLFPTTVLETALTGRHPFLNNFQWESRDDIAIAEQALADLQLSALCHRTSNSLSGGEQQRLKVATLLTQKPKLMLLDEPTNHLDPRYQIRVLELLQNSLETTGGAIIMVLHDINLAARFCSHLLLMGDNGLMQSGPMTKILQPDLLSRAYGWPIIEHRTSSGVFFTPQ
jgi:iron complex transport system ATP-binding protein